MYFYLSALLYLEILCLKYKIMWDYAGDHIFILQAVLGYVGLNLHCFVVTSPSPTYL